MLVLMSFFTLARSLRRVGKTGESVTEHLRIDDPIVLDRDLTRDREQVLTQWQQELDWSAVDESIRDFVHWRFANHTMLSAVKLQAQDHQRCLKVVTPLPETEDTLPMKVKGGQVPHAFFTDERVADFIDNVDHIYYICMKCTRQLPHKLIKKTSIINGRQSDACLHVSGHWNKITAAHRLAVLHAKQNNYKTALVLEEDANFDVDSSQFDFESIAKLIHDDTKEWQMMRINWFDFEGASGECKKVRKCNQWVEQNMCTGTFKTNFHSSAAYIIPARSYDRFLHHGTNIDGNLLGQFVQTILTPNLVHQHAFRKAEFKKEGPFIKHCKAENAKDVNS